MFEFELPDFQEILGDGRRMLLEQQVKHNGIWRIHKADPDDIFPSDAHADRVDEPETVDLYNGNVYSKINKQFLYSLPKKAMKYIHAEIMNCKEEEIKSKLRANRSMITYLSKHEQEN